MQGLCYSTNGNDYTLQIIVSLEVLAANSDALTAISPVYVGTNVSTVFAIAGQVPSQFARVGLGPGGLCGGSLVAEVDYNTSAVVSVDPGIQVADDYALCYSVEVPSAFTAQDGIVVSVLDANPDAVAAFSVRAPLVLCVGVLAFLLTWIAT